MTATCTDWGCVDPPAPVHTSVNVEVALKFVTCSLPDAAFDPLQSPLALHPVALLLDHVRVVEPPVSTDACDALNVAAGAVAGEPTVTVTVRCAAGPPLPEQLNV